MLLDPTDNTHNKTIIRFLSAPVWRTITLLCSCALHLTHRVGPTSCLQAMQPHGTFIQGEVVALSDSSATLADGTQLRFDYAVVATGSSYAVGKSSTATTLQQRLQELQVGLAACCGMHSHRRVNRCMRAVALAD
jgi:hypothetical protein